MSQVLVGEIVFKMKADADNMLRTIRNAQAQARSMQADVNRLNSELRDQQRAMDETSRSTRGAEDAMRRNAAATRDATRATRDNHRETRKLGDAVEALRGKLMSGLKIPALVTAGHLAAAALASVSTAALSLGSALVPLAGALSAYPGMFLAVGSSLLTVKAALAPVVEGFKALASGDQKKIAAAFAEMTPAAASFTRELWRMKEAFDFTGVAQQGMLPGLLEGLRAASPLVGVLREQVYSLAKTLGGVAKSFGEMVGGKDATSKTIGYNRFYRDTARLGAMNTVIVRNLGGAFMGLFDALRSIMAAAAPFLIWLSDGARKMGEWAAATVSANRANGSLLGFFQRTAIVGATLGNTLKNIVGGLSGISRAGGSAQGFTLLQSMERAAAKFNEFTHSASGVNKIQKFFADAKAPMHEFGGLLRDVLAMFTRLSTSTALVKVISDIRTKMLPALENLANGVSQRLGPALVEAATAFINFQNALSFTPLIVLIDVLAKMVNGLSKLIAMVPGLGFVVASFLAMATAIKAVAVAQALMGGSTLTTLALNLRNIGIAAGASAVGFGGLAAGIALVAAPLAAIGILFYAFSKSSANANQHLKEGNDLAQKRLDIIRAANPKDGAFSGAIDKDKEIAAARAAMAAYKALGKAKYDVKDDRSLGERAKANFKALKDWNILSKQAWSTGGMGPKAKDVDKVKAYHDALAKLPPELRNMKDLEGFLTRVEEQQTQARENATKAAMEQRAGYELLTGSTLELGNAWKGSREQAEEMISTMGKAATTAAAAVRATGNLVEIFNNAHPAEGQSMFAVFKADAEEVLKNARSFNSNITRALQQGYSSELIGQLAAQGPKAAGPILDALVHNATRQNIRFFNEYSKTLEKIAVKTAYAAKIMAQAGAADAPAILAQTAGKMTAIAGAFADGAGSIMEVANKLGWKVADVTRIMALFGMTDLSPTAHVAPVLSALEQVRLAIAGIEGPHIVSVIPNVKGPYIPGGKNPATHGGVSVNNRLNADGNLLVSHFARGGMRENRIAQIARGGEWRVWAEPETGGEAYIPLALAKRARSMQILSQTAQRMGARVSTHAAGSFAAGSGTPITTTSAQNRAAEAAASSKSSTKQITAAAQALSKSLSTTINRLVQQITAVRDKIQTRYETIRDFRTTAVNAGKTYGGLAGLSRGSDNPTSVGDVTRTINERAADIRSFTTNIRKASAKGLSKDLISQLVAMGPGSDDARAIAESFATASGTDIKKANAAQTGLNKSASGFGSIGANSIYGEGTEGRLLSETQRQTAILERIADRMSSNTTSAQNSRLVNDLVAILQQAKSRGKTLGLA